MALTLDALKVKLRDATEAGVTLTKDDCMLLVKINRPVSFSLKFGRSNTVVSYVDPSQLTADFIENEARLKWRDELKGVILSLYSDKESKHQINDTYLQKCAYPLTVFVKTTQQGFSDFTPSEALKYAGIKEISLVNNDHAAFPQPIEIKDDNEFLLHTMKDLEIRHTLYDPIEEGCEYTRREFISPILILAASIAGVKLACEEQVDGSAGKGPVDWIVHYLNHRICITEGKKDNITQGLYQNLAQLTAAGEGRGEKRAFRVDLPLYGIATTYVEWIFIRLDPSATGQDRRAMRLRTMGVALNTPYLKQTVRDVAGRLAGLLSHQKNLVDKESGESAKRQKSNKDSDKKQEEESSQKGC